MKARKPVKARQVIVTAPADVIEVLERVLDRGIVIDAWLRVSLTGLTLVDIDARIVVASIRTYVLEGDAVAGRGTMPRPAVEAAPAKRPAPAPRRARRPRRAPGKVMLRCADGCTFLRSGRLASSVRCPSDHARRCAVAPVA